MEHETNLAVFLYPKKQVSRGPRFLIVPGFGKAKGSDCSFPFPGVTQ